MFKMISLSPTSNQAPNSLPVILSTNATTHHNLLPYINLLIFRLVNAHVNVIGVLREAECDLGIRQGRCQDKVLAGSHAVWDWLGNCEYNGECRYKTSITRARRDTPPSQPSLCQRKLSQEISKIPIFSVYIIFDLVQFYDDIFLQISNFGIFIRFAGVRTCQYQTIYRKKITEIPIFLVYIICDVGQFFACVRTCSVRTMNLQKLCVSLSSSKSQTITTWTRLWLLDPLSIVQSGWKS